MQMIKWKNGQFCFYMLICYAAICTAGDDMNCKQTMELKKQGKRSTYKVWQGPHGCMSWLSLGDGSFTTAYRVSPRSLEAVTDQAAASARRRQRPHAAPNCHYRQSVCRRPDQSTGAARAVFYFVRAYMASVMWENWRGVGEQMYVGRLIIWTNSQDLIFLPNLLV